MSRADGRAFDELRPTTITPGFLKSAPSALIEIGATRVLCTAIVENGVPPWLRGQGRGWLTAEYGMLPASTGQRKPRDATRGKLDGRTVEIQRLIGRSLRAVVDLAELGENTLWVDCDVLEADVARAAHRSRAPGSPRISRSLQSDVPPHYAIRSRPSALAWSMATRYSICRTKRTRAPMST